MYMISNLLLLKFKAQWSPVNPETKKAYDRSFNLELQNNTTSKKKPEGLTSLKVVRDKVRKGSCGIFVRLYTCCT